MSQATLSAGPYLNSNLFSSHYLDERIYDLDEWDCDEAATDAFEELRALWEAERELVDSYKEDELLDSWIDEVLSVLGFDTLSETTLPGESRGYNDRLLFSSKTERREAAFEKKDGRHEAMYDLASALLEAKQWNASFEDRFSEDRSYRDASHQVKYYLERTPEKLQWGVLTNGRKWRLYGTKDYETQTYYEVDLPELLESGGVEAFKYFFVFFRPEAFEESGGTTFLNTVWNESETAAQELGEDLQNNVFTALRVLGKGFVETNDLDIDPGDEAALDELKEQSLVLLYRLMFTLYAESRNLINPDDPTRRSEYEEHFSLDQLRLDILDEVGEGGTESGFDSYSTFSTAMWSRLENLFSLIDSGEESLGIPPYNGGLFSEGEHEFLTENEVADRYLAEVIYRLSTTETDDGFVLADYADLDTRHLGTIYEGLLEHEFRIAPTQYAAISENGGQVWKDAAEVSVADAVETVDAGGLYVVNDDGERKATGAYYTPDYVVTYIVEETIDPLLEDVESDLEDRGLDRGTQEYVFRFADEVLDLKVLDPAMGSGHFLTKATSYLAEQVMERVRELETATAFDEQQIRREISRECIYGVDLNGMAVELAKLSMWLETLAANQPLAFLDHHLKTGNSLVGSDITEVLADDGEDDDGQLTLTQALARVRQRTLEHVMELMQDLLAVENESYEDIKSMEEMYAEIRADPLYQRLFEMANVHTAERFGVAVPDDAYEEMAQAIEDGDEWAAVSERDWFVDAQAVAADEDFFHWELEFPEVFFSPEGKKSADAGFDAVVGNPPYVRQEQITHYKKYFQTYRSFHSSADLYVYFLENGLGLCRDDGRVGYITSNKFMRADYGRHIRTHLTNDNTIHSIVDFGELPVFRDASTFPAILILSPNKVGDQSPHVTKIKDLQFDSLGMRVKENRYTAVTSSLSEDGWSLVNERIAKIHEKIDSQSTPLGDYLNKDIKWGIKTGLNDAFVIDEKTRSELIERDSSATDLIEPLLVGDDVRRFHIEYSNQYLIKIPSGWTEVKSQSSDEEAAWSWLTDTYPSISDHLSKFEKSARERYDQGQFWWELRPCDYYDQFESEKIIYPEIMMSPRFVMDTERYYTNNKCFMIPESDWYLLSLLNSNLLFELAKSKVSVLGDEDAGGRLEMRTVHVKGFPIRDISLEGLECHKEDIDEFLKSYLSIDNTGKKQFLKETESKFGHSGLATVLAETGKIASKLHNSKFQLNLSLPDYLGNYSDGQTLSEIGFQQPVAETADAVFNDTTEEREKLGVTEVTFTRENPNTLTVNVGVRYKPENPDDYETDTYGYYYEDPKPAFRITDLTETEADLIAAFVPHAVDEAGGYANFRTNATKTNSPLDRLKKLTLPKVEDVYDGLENYIETVERADELEAKIERTDELIDEIVYELYGLTDEEIEIVEESVKE